jgi:hypothetical protein
MTLRTLVLAALALPLFHCASDADGLVDDPEARSVFESLDAGVAPMPLPMDFAVPTMVRGTTVVVPITGAPPNRTTVLVASGQFGGPPACPPQLGGDCLLIPNPFVVLGQGRTDAAGTFDFVLNVPSVLPLSRVQFQAIAIDQGTVYATRADFANVVDIAAEVCNDRSDNDGNGLYDCADPACASNSVCGVLGPENSGAACTDGIDNDGDGFADCADFSCRFDLLLDDICGVSENTNFECLDGADQDGNGFVDCADFGCQHDKNPNTSVCIDVEDQFELACNDGLDNDGDGSADCDDLGCFESFACGGYGFFENDALACSDGVDNDGNLLIDCDDPACGAAPTCLAAPEDTDLACSDTLDNDLDGLVDCFDPDCATTVPCSVPTTDEITVNEFLADPGPDPVLGDANCDGVRDGGDDEFVELTNYGTAPVSLAGVTIADQTRVRHAFGPGESIPPGGVYVVFGGGTPTFDGTSTNPSPVCAALPPNVQIATATGGSFGLNNTGDTLFLARNGVDFEITDFGAAANADQSLTRDVDGDPTSAFGQHGTTGVGPQSPGRRADLTDF